MDVGNAGFFGQPIIEGMLRKAVQRKRRCALKTNMMGGGLQVAPGAPFESSNGVPYATNARYDDCYTQGRPGALTTEANVALAQTAMAGGNRFTIAHPSARRTRRRVAGGAVADFVYTPVAPAARKSRKGRKGGKRSNSRNSRNSRKIRGGCGCMWKGGQRGGQCPYKAVGGQCPYKVGGRKTMRGGNRGFSIDVAQSVGGEGPNVAAINAGLPCDARAGANNPNTLGPLPLDPRAYGVGYSATANSSTQAQTGGQLSERIPNFTYSETMMGGGYGGNAFDPACYKAPGSEMPVYPAVSAGFHFTPNIASGEALPSGVIPFNEVIQHTARLGGARKRTYRKKAKKTRRSRRH